LPFKKIKASIKRLYSNDKFLKISAWKKCLLLPKMTVFGQSDHLTVSPQARTARPMGGGQASQQQDERRAESVGRARNRGDGPAWCLLRARDPGHPSQASPGIRPARPPTLRNDCLPGKPARPDDIAACPDGPDHGRRPGKPSDRTKGEPRAPGGGRRDDGLADACCALRILAV